MTRGRCGSLFLQRMKLSFTTPCRFRPAHGGFYVPRSRLDIYFAKASSCSGSRASLRIGCMGPASV
jgi:hypothetical protein